MSLFFKLSTTCFLPLGLMATELNVDSPQATTPSAQGSKDNSEVNACTTTYDHPPIICAYNAPNLANPNAPANLYVAGSFIYWRASADYLASGFLDNSFSPDPDDFANISMNGSVLEPDFEYKPGFKLGLGYKIHRDRWDLFAEYTQLYQTTSTHEQVKPGGQHIHAIWLVFIAPVLLQDEFQSVSSKWKTNFDILDVEVARNFFCGRYLAFRSSLGLRTLWLDQKYNLVYKTLGNAIPVFAFNHSSSWGIGPRFAIDTAWNLTGGFKVIGDIAVSLLHVEDQVRVKQTIPFLLTQPGITTDVIYKNRESIGLVKPILDVSLGLSWGRPLFKQKCAFDISVTYDYSIYWDQGSIQLGHAPIVAPGSPLQVIVGSAALSTGNVSVQGLEARARFDF
jgi:hypothetical protein